MILIISNDENRCLLDIAHKMSLRDCWFHFILSLKSLISMPLYPSTSLIYHDNIIIYSNPLSDSQWIQIHWRHFIQCSCQNASGNLTPNIAYPITLLMTLYSYKSLVRQFLIYLFNSAKAYCVQGTELGGNNKERVALPERPLTSSSRSRRAEPGVDNITKWGPQSGNVNITWDF